MTRILIADDHVVFRLGLRILVDSQSDLELCGEAANGVEVVELYREVHPDMVMMDIRMPKMSGVEAIRTLKREFPLARILVLSSYANEEDIYQAIKAGAQGYVLKDTGRDDLLGAVRAVAAGAFFVPPFIADRLAGRNPALQLTERETQVLELIVKGLTSREIAVALQVSENTVKSHVNRIFMKLEVNDRAEAVSAALQRGIIALDS